MGHYLKTEYDLTDPSLISVFDDLPLWSAPFGMKLLDTVNMKHNMKVLDIGSGFGFPLIELSQRLGSSCKVYGIDPWKSAIDRVNQKIKIWNLSNVEIIEGQAEELPFEDSYFDLIISNNGINNVEDDKKVLFEIARTSKTGAQLVVTVNLPDTMIEFYNIYEKVLLELGKKDEAAAIKEHIYSKRKPVDYTKELIENAGYQISKIYEDSFQFRYVDGTTMLNNFIIKLAFLGSWKSILKEDDIQPVFEIVEKELNEIAKQKGEFVLTTPWICVDAVKID